MTTTAYRVDPLTRTVLETFDLEESRERPGAYAVPDFCYIDPPPQVPDGQVLVRKADASGWEVLPDNRGLVYGVETGEQIRWGMPGDLPEHVTAEAPANDLQSWDGKGWRTDPTKVAARRDELIAGAGQRVAVLQDAVDLDMADDAERTALLDWKRYRVLLSRIDVSGPTWPESPEN